MLLLLQLLYWRGGNEITVGEVITDKDAGGELMRTEEVKLEI